METIHLNLDQEHFPELIKRYNMNELRDMLCEMCLKQKMDITEENLYSVAANLESDLEHMFG